MADGSTPNSAATPRQTSDLLKGEAALPGGSDQREERREPIYRRLRMPLARPPAAAGGLMSRFARIPDRLIEMVEHGQITADHLALMTYLVARADYIRRTV